MSLNNVAMVRHGIAYI